MRKIPRKLRKGPAGLQQYAGQWIMLVGSKVIAHDKSLSEAISEASLKPHRGQAAAFLVPRKDEGPYLLSS